MNTELGGTAQQVADNLLRFGAQYHDLVGRIVQGTVSLGDARKHLQAAILGHPGPSSPLPAYFVSCARQILNVEAWNRKYGWGFTEADIAKAYVEAATFTWPADTLQAIVLVPSLATPVATFTALCGVMADSGRGGSIAGLNRPSVRDGDYSHVLDEHPDRLWLAEGVEFRANSLQWRLVDLGAMRTREGHWRDLPSAVDLVSASDAASGEVMAAAAHFPGWYDAVRNKEVPAVYATGYRTMSYRFGERTAEDLMYVLAIYPDNGGWVLVQPASPSMSPNQAVATSTPMALGGRLGL